MALKVLFFLIMRSEFAHIDGQNPYRHFHNLILTSCLVCITSLPAEGFTSFLTLLFVYPPNVQLTVEYTILVHVHTTYFFIM